MPQNSTSKNEFADFDLNAAVKAQHEQEARMEHQAHPFPLFDSSFPHPVGAAIAVMLVLLCFGYVIFGGRKRQSREEREEAAHQKEVTRLRIEQRRQAEMDVARGQAKPKPAEPVKVVPKPAPVAAEPVVAPAPAEPKKWILHHFPMRPGAQEKKDPNLREEYKAFWRRETEHDLMEAKSLTHEEKLKLLPHVAPAAELGLPVLPSSPPKRYILNPFS